MDPCATSNLVRRLLSSNLKVDSSNTSTSQRTHFSDSEAEPAFTGLAGRFPSSSLRADWFRDPISVEKRCKRGKLGQPGSTDRGRAKLTNNCPQDTHSHTQHLYPQPCHFSIAFSRLSWHGGVFHHFIRLGLSSHSAASSWPDVRNLKNSADPPDSQRYNGPAERFLQILSFPKGSRH